MEQNTTKKGRMDKNNITKLDASDDSKKYKIESIRDSTVYAKKLVGYLLGLYYLVSWKKYLKEENTWEHILAV